MNKGPHLENPLMMVILNTVIDFRSIYKGYTRKLAWPLLMQGKIILTQVNPFKII